MVSIRNLCKSYGTLQVVNHLSLEIGTGEVVTVIGPSGTGKSTLLRCINYLETPSAGSITVDDLCVDAAGAKKKDIHRLRKETSMVFQNYNLFNNKTALENIMEPMVVAQRVPKAEARKRALEILEMVRLSDKRDAYPSRLSGGQQQRVSIGRAMATTPKIILLDEPTSSLDPELVGEVLEVIGILARRKVSMLIATHEMEFARRIADRVVFMENGSIVEEGAPEELFEHAQNERTRAFLGRYYEQPDRAIKPDNTIWRTQWQENYFAQ
ncbi:amino acid ABC transporter ATP-binding protein [Ruminococcaceae bacterium OttesenSCG-928-L11]|nr:amino acid ABC transporter ATP-binding protein [Ruminococcaceae bacterium OttesenSCG-928-L11]